MRLRSCSFVLRLSLDFAPDGLKNKLGIAISRVIHAVLNNLPGCLNLWFACACLISPFVTAVLFVVKGSWSTCDIISF